MPTYANTWSDWNAGDENLADQGPSANVTYSRDAGDGNPAACGQFVTTADNLTNTELAYKTATGDTWESVFGVTPGEVVQSAQVVSWYTKDSSNFGSADPLVGTQSAYLEIDLISDAGVVVHSAGYLARHDMVPGSTGGWTGAGAGAVRAIDAAYQASSTGIRLRLKFASVTGAAPNAITLKIDEVEIEIITTGGSRRRAWMTFT